MSDSQRPVAPGSGGPMAEHPDWPGLSHDLPPLLWLEAFEVAARTLSFTAAGRELNITQSAVSQRIRLLEDRLGQQLFVRHPRSLSLSLAGQAWLPSIQAAFVRLRDSTAEVFGLTRDAPVTLRATPLAQQAWLAPRLVAFHREHPEVALHLASGFWITDFGSEGADMEIRYGRGDWEEQECVALGEGEEQMVVLAAPELAARLQGPEDLAGQTLLHSVGFAVGWRAWLQAAGVAELERQTRRVSCDTQVMALELARQGMGLALAHRNLFMRWQREVRHGLVPVFDLCVSTPERFWLVRPLRRQLRAPAQQLWDWLVRHRCD
ncbi:LysR substrate-binding domain-containing protein [Pseudomonas sp. MBLB4123]|uniref:LysR substrate-binding domain-containing protein n=1 Tax=Pseudomonas sp. MBLB4123 TaxID=3451557 RepID=UPI003F754DA7